ncbi:cyclin-I [Paramormyrops kingsleyae]|uniref:Cyclin I family member 2 n=1 Tax=Paramormyrops kingsleyae TaxID=1676925 RepID=A0A3B3QSW9_9TELE|nr:cyclin-I-like [Paramormyrops kingsleyae]XP_023647331.1 cyclin-I-like [Paramormyrops kingsleyae]XP_023647333.1 cyclin-I-like [Paramormyrops kingsleyae]
MSRGSAGGRGPLRVLGAAVAREARLWKAPVFRNGRIQGTDISAFQQEDAITWLGNLCRLLKFCPETFALAVSILNRLLASVKAHPKYLRCIAITSLILAAKVNEEDEVIVSVKELVSQSAFQFSAAEIFRMERIILDKLQWDLYTSTALDFVHIFHALVLSGHPHLPQLCAQKEPCPQVALWSRQVQHCMACHQLSQFKGSTLALAIITLEAGRLTPDWFSVFTDLLKKAQIDSTELIRCREMVEQRLHLRGSLKPSVVYIFDPTSITYFQNSSSQISHPLVAEPTLLQADAMEGEDDVCDGFGCLYSEGLALEVRESHSAHSATMEGCPPLQPPDC